MKHLTTFSFIFALVLGTQSFAKDVNSDIVLKFSRITKEYSKKRPYRCFVSADLWRNQQHIGRLKSVDLPMTKTNYGIVVNSPLLQKDDVIVIQNMCIEGNLVRLGDITPNTEMELEINGVIVKNYETDGMSNVLLEMKKGDLGFEAQRFEFAR